MKEIKKGSTSITEYFNLVDKTAGTPKTGVAEDQIYLSYVRNRSTLVASVCATLASGVAAFSAFGAFEVDATNAPGLYRVDVPDAAFSTGVDKVILTAFATTTSSVAPAIKEVILVDNVEADTYTIVATTGAAVNWAKVLNPTTAVDLSGTLISRGQTITAVTGAVGSVSGGVTGSVGSVVGNVGGSVGSVVGGVGGAVAGSVGSVVGNVGGSVASVVGNVGGSVANVTGNVGSVSGGVAGSVGSVVGNVGGSVGSVVGNVGGSVGSVVGGVGSSVTVGTNNDKSGYVLSAIGSAALTEDYPTDGAAGTLNQMLYAILQNLGDFSITGTVRTVNKLDGSTTAMQYSLNSSTAPTATTRFL